MALLQIFRLEPRVGSDFADEEHSELVRGELSANEKADKVREPNLLFGTKRSVTQVRSMLTWALDHVMCCAIDSWKIILLSFFTLRFMLMFLGSSIRER